MGDRGNRKWTAWKYHVTTLLCLLVWVLKKIFKKNKLDGTVTQVPQGDTN